MGRIFLFLIFYSVANTLFAQPLKFAKRVGGTSFENAMGIAVDSSGNIIIAGYFAGTADFDPSASDYNLTSQGGNDIFLAKYDSAGNFLWAIDIGGQFEDFTYADPVVDAAGNIFIGGQFGLTVDFNPTSLFDTLTSFGNYDGFVASYDSAGNFNWVKQFGGINADYVYRSEYDNGSVLFTGAFDSIADLDPTSATNNFISNGADDVFFGRLDVTGNLIFASSFGGYADDAANNITHDLNGNIIIAGSFTDSADVDPSSNDYFISGIGFPSFISKYDSNGNFLWAFHFNYSIPYGLSVDTGNNILTCGSFMNTVDFDPGTNIVPLTSAGNFDLYFGKYDAAGNYVFAKRIGSTQIDLAYQIREIGGTIFMAGYFYGTVDFDAGTPTYLQSSAGFGDIFLTQYSSSGNFISAFRVGGTGFDFCRNFALDASNLYMAGGFEQSVDFDQGAQTTLLTSAGSRDGYFAVYGSVTNSITENTFTENSFSVYPNPFDEELTVPAIQPGIKLEIKIYDLYGKELLAQQLMPDMKLQTSNLATGVYFLKVTAGGKSFYKKIVHR